MKKPINPKQTTKTTDTKKTDGKKGADDNKILKIRK